MNLEQALQLFAKYLPVFIGIVQREAPAINAFITDLKAINAGQPASAVIPPQALTQFPPSP